MTSIGGQQIFQSGGQQYLIVNKALGGSGGRIQIVDQAAQDSASAAKFRREILARQPSYCKILNDLAGNDLKEVESSESEDTEIPGEEHGLVSKQEKEEPEAQGQALVMKGETLEVVEGSPSVSDYYMLYIIRATFFTINIFPPDPDSADQRPGLSDCQPGERCEPREQRPQPAHPRGVGCAVHLGLGRSEAVNI